MIKFCSFSVCHKKIILNYSTGRKHNIIFFNIAANETKAGCNEPGDFLCKNNLCLNNEMLVCNGADDCGDFSDETGCSKCQIILIISSVQLLYEKYPCRYQGLHDA